MYVSYDAFYLFAHLEGETNNNGSISMDFNVNFTIVTGRVFVFREPSKSRHLNKYRGIQIRFSPGVFQNRIRQTNRSVSNK